MSGPAGDEQKLFEKSGPVLPGSDGDKQALKNLKRVLL